MQGPPSSHVPWTSTRRTCRRRCTAPISTRARPSSRSLQNCPVYNDNEWLEVEDRKTRVSAALTLHDGEPLVYGPKDDRKGIRIQDGVPSVVSLGPDEDPVEAGVAVHHEAHESPSYAFALASLARPDFPLPTGVFRAVEKPSYERMLQEQVDGALEQRGAGDLGALLHSGDTWSVEG